MYFIIQSILLILLILFSIRLYTTKGRFRKFINLAFNFIEQCHQNFRNKKSKSYVWLIIGTLLFSAIMIWLADYDGLMIAITLLCLVFLPTLPTISDWIEHRQRSEMENAAYRIKHGQLTEADLFKIKQAMKIYYQQKYVPKPDSVALSPLLSNARHVVSSLVHPVSWWQSQIPRLTSRPAFASFFYNSPHHARFAKFNPLLEQLVWQFDKNEYRLQVDRAEVDENYLIIYLKDLHKHTYEKAARIAKDLVKIEKLPDNTISAQKDNDQVKIIVLPVE